MIIIIAITKNNLCLLTPFLQYNLLCHLTGLLVPHLSAHPSAFNNHDSPKHVPSNVLLQSPSQTLPLMKLRGWPGGKNHMHNCVAVICVKMFRAHVRV